MPHIDEGTLHALLDGALPALAEAGALPPGGGPAEVGAHLRACADCRARLEEERAIREAAGEVLKDAGTLMAELPPFDDIVPGRSRPRRTGGWVPLAWAASLVLALGAGWSANMLWRAPDRMPAAAPVMEPALADGEAAAEDAGAAGLGGAVAGETGAAAEARSQPADVTGPPAPRVASDASGAAPARDAVAAAPARPVGVAPEPAGQRVSGEAIIVAAPPAAALSKTVAPAGAVQARAVTPAERAAPHVEQAEQAEIMAAPSSFAAERLAHGGPAQAGAAAMRAAMRQADAGMLEWREPADPAAVADAGLVLRDGGEAGIEVASLLGATLIRARQQVGEAAVEVYTWRAAVVSLSEVVITGAAPPRQRSAMAGEQREARAALPSAPQAPQPPRRAAGEPVRAEPGVAVAVPPPTAPLITTVVADSVLPGGVRELLVHAPAAGAWIVLRAELGTATLTELARQLVPAR